MDQVEKVRPQRGEVWYWKTERLIGGCLQKPGRPVIIVSNDKCNDNSSVLTIVPLTTKVHRFFPQQVPVICNERLSIALGDQIQSVPIDELVSYFGRLEKEQMKRVDQILLVQLGIELGNV